MMRLESEGRTVDSNMDRPLLHAARTSLASWIAPGSVGRLDALAVPGWNSATCANRGQRTLITFAICDRNIEQYATAVCGSMLRGLRYCGLTSESVCDQRVMS